MAREVAAIGLLLLMGGCGGPSGVGLPPVPDSVPTPDISRVESVIFLLGDAGDAVLGTSPTLARLQQDIDSWSSRIAEDSSVVLLVLGDVRYPEGVRPSDDPAFVGDSAVVMSQVRMVGGAMAREHGAHAYFMAGNHDWGLREHFEGYVRLNNLQVLLDSARVRGEADGRLVPDAGTGGPFVLDWGEHFRLLLLDTAWWILEANEGTRAVQLAEIEEAIRTAGDREIMIAGHHPFKSAGSHGGEFAFWRTLGLRYLLNRAGAILEDVTSIPYREYEFGLRRIFSELGPPLIYAGGHDHSLQVLESTEPTDPRFGVVAGSGSKLTGVGTRAGVVFGNEAPGYMRIVVERDGGATLFVEATPQRYLVCPTAEEARVACMAEGMSEFRTVYWTRLK